MLWQILIQFVFRLGFGLAAAMAWTSPRWVTAGFYRVQLWVALGLSTFVAAIVYLLSDAVHRAPLLGVAVVAGALSYIGAVIWLYEWKRPGQIALVAVAAANLLGALWSDPAVARDAGTWWAPADTLTSGILLGTAVTAMLLGHWYLTTPTMKLFPLQRLVILLAAAAVLRAVVAGFALGPALGPQSPLEAVDYALLALRWLAGLVGVLMLAWMTWRTLKIPNTQSATGLLYVAVIFAFLGELSAQLLSARVEHLV
jgi:hypothetical protein